MLFESLESRQLLAGDVLATAWIVNGTPTSEFPSVGIVGDVSGGFCSGTLISPQHVLTAAHCAEGVGDNSGTFQLGGTVRGTSSVIVHPNWNDAAFGTDNAHDIAIYVLNQPFSGITPSAIFRGTPQVGQELTLVGYGAGGTGNSGHNHDFGTKRVGKTPIDNVTTTLIHWNFDDNSESNTAPGDSGGPAFLLVNGQYQVAGITSGGDQANAGIGDHSYDTRVDAYQSWIDSIVGNAGGGGGGGGGGTGDGDGGGGDTGGSHEFTNNSPVAIDPNSTGTVTSSINVSGVAGNITDVNVTVDISHTWNEDLVVTLVSPGGTRVELFNGVGGSQNNFTNTTLDDEASTSIASGSAPFTGSFRPQGTLANLDGENPNGTWTLEVRDTFAADGGALNHWTLAMTTDGTGSDDGGSDDGGGDSGGGDGETGTHEFSNNTPIAIDPNAPGTVTSSINVTNVGGTIADVNVTVDISHTWNEDLVVTLVSPSGTRVELFNGVGGSQNNFTNTTLDDEASTSIASGSAPFTGSFRPQGMLANLDGENPNGTWTLEVRDTFAADGGALNRWTLVMTTDGTGSDGAGDGGGGGAETGTHEFSNNTPVAIDPNAPGTVTSSINVTNVSGTIADVNVTVDISHTWNEDLVVTLISPSGTRVELFNGIGGNQNNFTNTTLDDEATGSITQASAPFTGTFRPQGSLAGLDGENPNGVWTLEVRDTFAADGGALNHWSLLLTTDGTGSDDGGGGGNGSGNIGTHEFSNNATIPIDPNTASTITSTINVTNLGGTIADVNVNLDISHTWDEDLIVTLISPNGTRVELFNGVGGNQNHFTNTTLDDESSTPITSGSAPFTGTFRPQGSLAALDGEAPNGVWTLEVQDTFAADGGALNHWMLTITTADQGDSGGGTPSLFNLEVRFTDNSLTASQQQVFQQAAQFWSTIIVGDIPDFETDIGLVDDIVIDAAALAIDGAGGILGQAGPTLVRPATFLPARGVMEFDVADLADLESSGQLANVIVHEMGHVIGIGTIWEDLNLIQGAGTSNPVFVGATAMTEYAAAFGLSSPTPVPVENSGGPGTRDGHWRESVFDNELMTGYLNAGQNPLSRITVGALADMGYQVNLAAADDYVAPGFRSLVPDIYSPPVEAGAVLSVQYVVSPGSGLMYLQAKNLGDPPAAVAVPWDGFAMVTGAVGDAGHNAAEPVEAVATSSGSRNVFAGRASQPRGPAVALQPAAAVDSSYANDVDEAFGDDEFPAFYLPLTNPLGELDLV